MTWTLATVALLAASVAGCGGAGPGGGSGEVRAQQAVTAATTTTTTPPSSAAPTPEPPVSTSPPPAPTAATTARPAPTKIQRPAAPPSTRATTTTAPPLAPPPTAAPPPTQATVTEPFESSVGPIDDALAARMTASWRPGCPVGLDDLRLVTVSHWGFDGRPRTGELVVRAQHADSVVGVIAALFRARFPIQQMRLVDEFGADDDRSMAANNTSAFNCRYVAGSDRWSEHAYGGAIDINPVQNPYVTRSGVSPPAGAAHTTRNASTPGLITRDGPVVAAFAAIGWGWGGSWSPGRDYQHFSASGR